MSRRRFLGIAAGITAAGLMVDVQGRREPVRIDQELWQRRLHELLGPERGQAAFERSMELREEMGENTAENVKEAVDAFSKSVLALAGKHTAQEAEAVNLAGRDAYLRFCDCWMRRPSTQPELLQLRHALATAFMDARRLTRRLPPPMQNSQTSQWAELHGRRWTSVRQLMAGNAAGHIQTVERSTVLYDADAKRAKND